MKAITAYVWDGGPTTVTKDQDFFWLVWAQSRVAIDTTLTVGISADRLDFGEQPVDNTPEPATWLVLIFGIVGLVMWREWPTMARRKVARLRAYRAVRP